MKKILLGVLTLSLLLSSSLKSSEITQPKAFNACVLMAIGVGLVTVTSMHKLSFAIK